MAEKEKDLLRFLTCGSVDDGKSTLIGRLLFDSKRICQDQLETLKKDTKKHGTVTGEFDYALLMDGLQSEREQGITIDVAYRYFETPARKFIIADCPGHEQYTRNMVTGASTANLATILVDASKGLLTQTRRHAFIVSLLKIPHVVLVVNKMDLVDYAENIFDDIVLGFKSFMEKLEVRDVTFLPVSALKGDNVVDHSKNMPWYHGPTLISSLEKTFIKADRNLIDFRFPVQNVIRPNSGFRGYAGRVESGTIAVGEEIIGLPSGVRSKIKEIVTHDGHLKEAVASQSVVLTLEDEIDISRGDMIVRKNNLPAKENHFDAMLCWMSETHSSKATSYILKHTTFETKANISEILYRVDVNTLHRAKTDDLGLNDIARVEIHANKEILFDSYRENRATGSFILIDPMTNVTVAAGMIRGKSARAPEVGGGDRSIKSKNITYVKTDISLADRESKNKHRAAVLWLTGLSGSGKSTIAKKIHKALFELGCQTFMLDGDNVRHGLNSDLGFSDREREENIRRIAEVAKLFYEAGHIVICSFISPFAKDRDFARSINGQNSFYEIYVKCDLDVCKRRDPKGLYKKALAGEIQGFTGIQAPYEEPSHPEILAETDLQSADEVLENILQRLVRDGVIRE